MNSLMPSVIQRLQLTSLQDWDCPGFNVVLQDQLKAYYGDISVENTIRYILPQLQTGNTHIAIYDLKNQYMYYSMVGLEGTLNRNAYERPYTRLNMQKLFVEQPSEDFFSIV
mmetsp:Transcript_24503/g.34339  ORF Transcript_24503/g.34339 Transcript_24503/m.34339 type:complete len:112 (-) Transcript_24503:74-409(-)